MRTLWLVIPLLAAAIVARAETYQDKKDREAIATIARSLDGLARDPALFDGSKIPSGADLRAVGELLDRLTVKLRTAAGAVNDLSNKARAQSDVQQLRAKLADLTSYRDALAPVLRTAGNAADAAKRKKAVDDQADAVAAHKTCTDFREELERGAERQVMHNLVELANGSTILFWQSVEEGAKYKGALDRIAATCARPEFAKAGDACLRSSHGTPPVEAKYCEVPKQAAEVMKRGVANLVAHHVANTGPRAMIARFASDLGWIQVDGVPSYKDFFAGKQLADQLRKRIAPLLAQAQMAPTDADALFGKLATEFAAYEAKVRELAPTWDMPGKPCTGVGCNEAGAFIGKWYGGAPRRLLETQAGWKIVNDEANVIVAREKYGYALFERAGEPFCQLRQWTLSEKYAGGGRYAPASDVTLGPVRWQPCK